MGKTMLIAGKEMPDGGALTNGVAYSGRNIIVTGTSSDDFEEFHAKRLTLAERKANQEAYEEEKNSEAKSGICTIEWNKSSPLSSRSLVLQTETIYEGMDEVVLYFDEEWFASKADKMDSEEISRGCDEMIVGYQFLANEVLSHFYKREEENPGTLVFMLKDAPSQVEALRNPSLRNGLSAVASPLVAAAASAFSSFAENIAALYLDSTFVNVILVRGDSTTDGFRRDDETGRWLCDYISSLDSQKKGGKKTVQWVKPGAKASGGFGIFRR